MRTFLSQKVRILPLIRAKSEPLRFAFHPLANIMAHLTIHPMYIYTHSHNIYLSPFIIYIHLILLYTSPIIISTYPIVFIIYLIIYITFNIKYISSPDKLHNHTYKMQTSPHLFILLYYRAAHYIYRWFHIYLRKLTLNN